MTSSLTALLFGCSLSEPKPLEITARPTPTVISERGFNVDILHPQSDTVGIMPGRQHTLGYPDRYKHKSRSLVTSEGKTVANEEKKKAVTEAKSLWDRYCSGEFIPTIEMNDNLSKQNTPAKWAGRCKPLK